MKDIHSNVKLVRAIDPDVYTTDQTGTGIDRQGFEAVEHVVDLGESNDTLSGSVYYDFILEESDDDSTYTAVTASASALVGSAASAVSAPDSSGIFATVDAAAEDNLILRIGYIGGKRYSRVKVDFTGTHTNGTPLSAFAILGMAEQAPTSD